MGLNGNTEVLYNSSRRYVKRTGKLADMAGVASVALWTVTGGPVLIEGIMGIVTTACQAAATTLAFTNTTAVNSTVVPMAAASGSISGDATETVFTMDGAVATGITIQTSTARGVGIWEQTSRQVLVPGIIKLVVGTATNTGIIDWYLSYVPLSDSSLVVST